MINKMILIPDTAFERTTTFLSHYCHIEKMDDGTTYHIVFGTPTVPLKHHHLYLIHFILMPKCQYNGKWDYLILVL